MGPEEIKERKELVDIFFDKEDISYESLSQNYCTEMTDDEELSKEELKAIFNKTKRFGCRTCGCVFDANVGEYTEDEYGTTYCKCPNCGKNAFEVKMREID